MAFIGRLFVIVFSVFLASIAAGLVIAYGLIGSQWNALSADAGERAGFWIVTFAGASFTGAAGLLPLAIAISISEALKIRSFLLHAVAGAAILVLGLYSSGLARPSYEESIDFAPPMIARETEIAAAAGVVFGVVYWLLAGRKAGRWRERP